jgi:hypothetical protein
MHILFIVSAQSSFLENGINYKVISPKNVAVISKEATYEGDVEIPNSVEHKGEVYSITTIGTKDYFLENIVSYMPYVYIPLAKQAFSYSEKLQSVKISSNVNSIENFSFSNCPNLKAIYIDNPNPENIKIEENTFWGVNFESCILYVPKGAESKYKNSEQWKKFKIIKVFE